MAKNKSQKTKNKKEEKQILSSIVLVKRDEPITEVFDLWTSLSNNLYNQSAFFYRNALSGNSKKEEDRHEHEQYAIQELESIFPQYKARRIESLQNEIEKLQNSETENEKTRNKKIKALNIRIQELEKQQRLFENKKTPNY